MNSVLVVGGTGTLGRSVVTELSARGHHVRVLSRRVDAKVPAGVDLVRGDIVSAEGIDGALDGVDTVVQSVANPRRMMSTEVKAMHTMVAAIGDRHLVNVSIVGVDRNRYTYYRAKLDAEKILEASSARWSNQRATQFHDLIERFLALPLFIRTPNLRFQPIDTSNVATRIVDLVEAGPSGRAPDIGGPEILGITELTQVRRRETGRRARLLPVPRFGLLGDFDHGYHLAPEQAAAGKTWAEWLRAGGGAKAS